MEVHKVERDPTLQIALDPVQRHLVEPSSSTPLPLLVEKPATHLLPNVDHLAVRNIAIEFLIQRLVARLVVLDPFLEVLLRLRGFLPIVVGIARSNLDGDIGRDGCRVGADGFNEEELEAGFAFDSVDESLSTSASRVRRVFEEDRNQLAACSKRKRRLPCIPTFPPALSHEMSCSRHSEAMCSRSREAALLLASKKFAD